MTIWRGGRKRGEGGEGGREGRERREGSEGRGGGIDYKHDYSYDSTSVSQMLKDLDLSSLENRRKMNKLTLL